MVLSASGYSMPEDLVGLQNADPLVPSPANISLFERLDHTLAERLRA
jgi:hypothetical protein